MSKLPSEVITRNMEFEDSVELVSIVKYDKSASEDLLATFTSKINGYLISKPVYFDFLIEKCIIEPESLLKRLSSKQDYYRFLANLITDICELNPFLNYNSMYVDPHGILSYAVEENKGFKKLVDNIDWNFPTISLKYSHNSFADVGSLDYTKNFIVKHNTAEMYLVVKSLDEDDINYLFKIKERLSSTSYKKYFCYYSIYHFYYVYSCFVDFNWRDIPEVYDDLYRMVIAVNPNPFIKRLVDENDEDDSSEGGLDLHDMILASNFLSSIPPLNNLFANMRQDKKDESKLVKKQKKDFETISRKEIDDLKEKLAKNIYGQDSAIDALIAAIKRAKVGLRKEESPVCSFIFTGPTGSGKCQPLYSKILTKDGWKTMGEINKGDFVLTPKGNFSKVLETYPQETKKDIYRVTFFDGRTADCSLNHLWQIHNPDWSVNNVRNIWKVKSLEDILNLGALKRKRIYVPLVTPKDSEDIQLPLDPYVMGILLGDGNFTSSSIRFSTADPAIVDYMKNYTLQYGLSITKDNNSKYDYFISGEKGSKDNYILNTIKDMGLYKKYSHEKFIPSIYMNSSYNQKLRLIQGLMDSDGSVSKNGGLVFYSTSQLLIEDMQTLIRSIGGIAKLSKKQTSYVYKGIKKQGKLSYVLNIRYRNPKDLVGLDRKKKNIPNNYQYSDLKLRIEKIEKIGNEFTKCILIDDKDHLYITDNYVVTHNTELSKLLCYELMGDKNAFVRIDCSEYQQAHEVSKLIGSPPGYVGHDEGGILVKKVIEYPFAVVLFDEIEKAHPKMYDILLQILDAGILTDSHGNTASFNNCMIIFTSNLASRDISVTTKPFGFSEVKEVTTSNTNISSIVNNALKKHFRPEFLGRIDEIIVFNSLGKDVCEKIVNKELSFVSGSLKTKGIDVTFDNSLIGFLLDKGFDAEYGARPIIKTIKKNVSDRIADYLLNNEETKTINVKIVDKETVQVEAGM